MFHRLDMTYEALALPDRADYDDARALSADTLDEPMSSTVTMLTRLVDSGLSRGRTDEGRNRLTTSSPP